MLDEERHTVATQVASLQRLTPGRTGNLSVRRGDSVAITPSGARYDQIGPEDVPIVSLDGRHLAGELPPSSETPMHRHIYRRFDAGAIVHVHSPWATTLAVLREPLPPVHYMIALAGDRVPVADYATYGTEALAENAVEAMEAAGSDACLLANHGLVATAGSAASALEVAETVESIARVYCQARAFGSPELLSADEIERTARKLDEYGPDGNGPAENDTGRRND
jgi:L-fuculose-phosphate aldolase